LDLAWLHLPVASTAIEATEVLLDPYVLLVPRELIPVSRRGFSDLQALSYMQMATLSLSPAAVQLRQFLHGEGIQADFILKSDDPTLIRRFVETQRIPALLPASLAGDENAALDVIPLPRIPPRRVGIGWCISFAEHVNRHAFIEAARETYAVAVSASDTAARSVAS
jgi:DNA-binding transcriptional LysR family regulator